MRSIGFILKKKTNASKILAIAIAIVFAYSQSYQIPSFANTVNTKKLTPIAIPEKAFKTLGGASEIDEPLEYNSIPNTQPQREIQTFKDENGNEISKEQKERTNSLKKAYKKVTKDEKIYEALELMNGGLASFSRNAILGNNLTNKPMMISFEDLSKFGQTYSNFDALGWKKKERLYIYINKKHEDAPAPALAAVLAHEALHQDEFNSLNEETYAWTLEAAVWTQLSEKNPQYNDSMHPLVVRENTLKKLFIKGNYTNKYIKKTVYSNPGYQNLPSRSPGFEDDSL